MYLTGFGGHFSTEAVAGALPTGRNSPQEAPYGLYAEQFSGTAFTAPRAANRRSWLYRLRSAASHRPFTPLAATGWLRTAPFGEAPVTPNRLRWDPLPLPETSCDWLDGLVTHAGNGDVGESSGMAIHLYACDRSMRRAFMIADGELLIVPQQGTLRIVTEFGIDFVIFPPRWMVAEDTFRPPWFHRNVMSEFMGLIQGRYDAKEGGFTPGGASLHNQMNGHGLDRTSYE